MKKILALFIALLMCGLLLMSYNAGKIHAIKSAQPFIVELPEIGDDYFTVYVDFGNDGVHEYEGTIC